MPHLEQRGQSPAPAASQRPGLNRRFQRLARRLLRRWALTWAVLHLAAFSLGSHWGAARPAPREPAGRWRTVVRVAALAPVGLAVLRGPWNLAVWPATAAAGLWAGWREAAERQGRVCAAGADPWAPAVPLACRGLAWVRLTGWSTPARNGGWRAPARLLGFWPAADCGLRPLPGQGLQLRGEGDPWPLGAVLGGRLTLTVPAPATVPGCFDMRRFLAGRDLRWSGRLEEIRAHSQTTPAAAVGDRLLEPLRRGLLQATAAGLPDPEARLAAAVLLGARTPASRAASLPFADLGLAHLFAVSGLHVGVLLALVLLPARRAGLSAAGRFLLLTGLLPVYVLLTGLPGSVVRAAGLGLLAAGGAVLGRRGDTLHLLGILFWGCMVWDPAQALDPGLRLSYLAAGGILATGRAAPGLLSGRGGLWGKLVAGLGVSLAASWFTLPQAAESFGRWSLVSPAANLAAVPLFGLAVWAVVLGLTLRPLWDPAGEAVLAWGWLVLRLLAALTAWAAGTTGGCNLPLPVPGPARILVWALLSAGLLGLLALGRPQRLRPALAAALLGLGLLAFSPHGGTALGGSGPTVWCFDVGQGDCLLVRFPDGWTGLIDAGGAFAPGSGDPDGPLSRTVLPFLRRQGLRRLEAVVLTHGHLDHTGGVAALVRAVAVERWWCGGRAGSSLAGLPDSAAVQPPAVLTTLHRWRDWNLELLDPGAVTAEPLHENDRSLVTLLRHPGGTCLISSGDLEQDGEAVLLVAGLLPAGAQIWKAGHHGSGTSGSPALLARLAPRLVLVSCGVGNSYGHPSHGPYLVRGDTIPMVRTDLEGSVRLDWTPAGEVAWSSRRRRGRIAPVP